MVDFKSLLEEKKVSRIVDPLQIFQTLDRRTGKEYLRPPQESILRSWHERYRSKRDNIVKLHTGQGKTLIGLLMLKSLLNEGKGPVVYLCPNNYLVDQTVQQAAQFGIWATQFGEDTKLPQNFLNSGNILVANCKKMFNGKSVFGVSGTQREAVSVGSIVVDDAHKCLDIIRESFSIIADRHNIEEEGAESSLYGDLWRLFEAQLSRQAPGTAMDIKNGKNSIQAVPFWAWHEKEKEVMKILRDHIDSNELTYTWDLIKDRIDQCYCIFSGQRVEVTPRIIPIDLIPAFSRAQHRIFLSATLNEDAFIVRDLGVDKECVLNPLLFPDLKYSGERMIVLPSLVETRLRRDELISWVVETAKRHRNFGTVALTPSFRRAEDWKNLGSIVTNVQDIRTNLEALDSRIEMKEAKEVLVMVNEYDGVDLPDERCRVLCLDSLPSYNSLADKYFQMVRPNSVSLRRQMAQRVEQGMGRGIRGSGDWCVVIAIGNDLTNFLSETSKRKYLSKEAQLQIEIGEKLADILKKSGGQRITQIDRLIGQCIGRDPAWKEYYRTQMSEITPQSSDMEILDHALSEREAEILFQERQLKKAVDILEKLASKSDSSDKGWYMQLIAAYTYQFDRTLAMEKQLKAYSENHLLFRPDAGVSYSKIVSTGKTQAERILEWIRSKESMNAVIIDIWEMLENLAFGSASDDFEKALDNLGNSLGFLTQRPDRTIGKGPDNLWQIRDGIYWIIECKNMVLRDRNEISKGECSQLSTDVAWFEQNYEGSSGTYLFIHPASLLAHDAYTKDPFWTITETKLNELKDNVQNFYTVLGSLKNEDLTIGTIKEKLAQNHLLADDIKKYLVKVESAS